MKRTPCGTMNSPPCWKRCSPTRSVNWMQKPWPSMTRLLPPPRIPMPPATNNRRLVYLSRYDADNADGNGNFFDAGMDEGLLWVRVEIEGTDQAIESLTSVYD